ncbi:DUF2637 domain-containing protein [Streptomyces cyaneofuscatus]|uniref:DUF2637 domain-containing protein n=1 Tax=Streptomyces cyaneofuscatus TaxID=66883 RepID=UPI00344B6B0D
MERRAGRISLNRTQRGLIAVVVSGAVVIAGIGFAGSYTAVRDLAVRKGFGTFAVFFPIGVDAGIAVLLALDLLLTWLRIPFPMLRQAAWLLTAATIGFNAAAAWPDPVGVGMHGVIPLLFVVTVEAARHAVGRLAAITADRHMEGVRLWRWVLAPLSTFKLWRRMMLWEIRKYDDVIHAEQERLVYQARLRGRHGRGWRWKAPVAELLPLRIARLGVPLEAASQERPPELEPVTATEASDRRDGPGGDLNGREPADDSTTVGSEPAAVQPTGSELPHPLPAQPPDRKGREPAQNPPHGRSVDAHDGTGPAGDPAPGASERAESAASVPGEELQPSAEDRVPDIADEVRAESDADHQSAVARLKSNAAAVRYAMRVTGSTHTPTVVDWLAAQGREVNRGQAHRITKDEEERQQGSKGLTVVKRAS